MERPKVRKYFKTTIIVTVVLTSAAVIGFQKYLKAGLRGAANPTPVRIDVIAPGELTEFVTAPGEIQPRTKVDISAKVSARIVELPHKEGARVTKGNQNAEPLLPPSVLIRLDSNDLESRLRFAQAGFHAQEAHIAVEKANIARQKAALDATAAGLKQAENDFARQKQLLESHDISRAAFDQIECRLAELQANYAAGQYALNAAELNLVVLQHRLDASREEIEQAKEALSYTTITSPIDGVITRINAEEGEMVMTGTMNNPGTVIMQVADLSQMILVAQVDEADIGNLKVGQKAKVRVQAFWDEEFTGTVDTIALTHDLSPTRTKYYKTEILLDENAARLHSGLTADVDIETITHSGIFKVPSQSVVSRKVDDLPLDIRQNNPNVDSAKTDALVVYRLVDGKAVATPVSIGHSDMTHIIVKSGLSDGDKVVCGPYKILESIRHDQLICDEAEKRQDDQDAEKTSQTPHTQGKNDA